MKIQPPNYVVFISDETWGQALMIFSAGLLVA